MRGKRVAQSIPWVGPFEVQSGSSPEPGGGGHWAELPPGPCVSPPAAGAHWLLLAPEPPPFPGNAALHTHTHTRGHCRNEDKLRDSLMWMRTCLTWMTIFLSARGRFLASLSASSHSLITCEQKEMLQMLFHIPHHCGEIKWGHVIATGMMVSI